MTHNSLFFKDASSIVHFLSDQLGLVMRELEPQKVYELEEKLRQASIERRQQGSSADPLLQKVHCLNEEELQRMASAFTIYFDLNNVAEDATRSAKLRQKALKDKTKDKVKDKDKDKDKDKAKDNVAGIIAHSVEQGVSPEQMQRLLEQMQIELVLTAHPTQSKRRTVLSKLQRISHHLHALQTLALTPEEQQQRAEKIQSEIAVLWLTDRSRTHKPSVTDEVRTSLYFVDDVFWEVLPQLYRKMERALAEHYPTLKAPQRWLTIASWVGGDRDGNPNVTHDITAEALRLHRGLALLHHQRSLKELSRRMSLTRRRIPPSLELEKWMEARRPLPTHLAFLEERYSNEPNRLALALLAADLDEAAKEPMVAQILKKGVWMPTLMLKQVVLPLQMIEAELPRLVAGNGERQIQQELGIFGLHAARLDLREESGRLKETLSAILRWTRLVDGEFEKKTTAEQKEILTKLLLLPPLELPPLPTAAEWHEQGEEVVKAAETTALFELRARTRMIYGEELLGPFVISMAHDAVDVLTVLLLATWTGGSKGMQIAPLFETLPDLKLAPKILSELFQLPLYREHLATCKNQQMVMIGYSDSNKDGGYLASNWSLYCAQEAIAAVCIGAGVDLTFFHGRGGSVARGGGPAHQAVRSLPAGTVQGRYRVTEQGEVLEQRYGDPELAMRHLEQMISAVIDVSLPPPKLAMGQVRPTIPIPTWCESMQALSDRSFSTFRGLVYETPDFLSFWKAATPIEEMGHFRMGSRPTIRRAGGLKLANVRAIPWVFSWMQSRFNLPSWYGVGTAFFASQTTLSKTSLALYREMYQSWPFFTALIKNLEMSLLKADMDIAGLYAKELMADAERGQWFFSTIRREYDQTHQAVLAIMDQTQLLAASPILRTSIERRNPYVDPLNFIQIETLKRLRAMTPEQQESERAASFWETLFLSVNGIAAGLRNTG
jgi:phosphoenolpyruvate carboxylase